MSDKKALYITTTLPYVNADPHIGFGLEIDEMTELALDGLQIARDLLLLHDWPLGDLTRGITNHSGPTTNKRNRDVARPLEVDQGHDGE